MDIISLLVALVAFVALGFSIASYVSTIQQKSQSPVVELPISEKNIEDIKKITGIIDQIAKLEQSNDNTQRSLIPNLQTSLMTEVTNVRNDLKNKVISKEIIINDENDWKLNTDEKGSICLRNPTMFVCIDRKGNLELPINL